MQHIKIIDISDSSGIATVIHSATKHYYLYAYGGAACSES